MSQENLLKEKRWIIYLASWMLITLGGFTIGACTSGTPDEPDPAAVTVNDTVMLRWVQRYELSTPIKPGDQFNINVGNKVPVSKYVNVLLLNYSPDPLHPQIVWQGGPYTLGQRITKTQDMTQLTGEYAAWIND